MDTRKAAMQVGAICLKAAVFVLIVVGIIYLGQTTYRCAYAVFCDQAAEEAPGKVIRIKISEDVSAKDLSKLLEKKGIVQDAEVFFLQMQVASFGNTVKAGTYELNTSMPPSEMFEVLSGGE